MLRTCLEVWSGLLITEMKEVHDKIYTANKDHEIVAIDFNSPGILNSKDNVDVKDVSAYVRSLHRDLNTCLDSINKTIQQSEYIHTLSGSFRKYLSSAICTTVLYFACYHCPICLPMFHFVLDTQLNNNLHRLCWDSDYKIIACGST